MLPLPQFNNQGNIKKSRKLLTCCIENSINLAKTSPRGGHGKSEPRSVGVLANAHGITLLLQRTKHQNHNSTKSFAERLQSKGLLVSQWHFLPQGTGTFPAAYLGASSLCVCCVAMLVLPPKAANSMQHSKSETYKKRLT